jgi:tetratricopeptide (TPR) repeat protein
MVHCRAGNPEKAIEILAPLVPVYRAARFRLSEVFTVFLGEAYWQAGRIHEAEQTLRELLKVIEPCGMRVWIGIAYRLLGEIASNSGAAGAAELFDRSLALQEQTCAQPELALTCASYGRLHRRRGSLDEARRYLDQALTISDRLGLLIDPPKLRTELAQL